MDDIIKLIDSRKMKNKLYFFTNLFREWWK